MLENALKGSFDSVACTGTAACTCTISDSEAVKNATTYSVSGSTLTTADGDSYEICAQGTSFRYAGKSLGAEEGSWELKKR